MGRGLIGRILEGIRKKEEDSDLQMYATEPPGAMGEDDGERVSFEKWMKKLDALFSAKLGLSIHDVEDMPFRDWYDSGMSPEEAFPDVMDRMRSEHGDMGGIFASKEEGCDEKDWITVEQMEEICPECAGNMRERNMTRLAMKEALECGLVEYVDAGQHQDVPAGELGEEKGDGWPRRLKKGRFSEYCRREGFSGPGVECARKAMDSEDASVRGMASFYMNTVQPKGKTATAVAGEKECGPTPDDEG